ncbi:MAG: HAD family phosphatase [Syntrophaceae bacterium]
MKGILFDFGGVLASEGYRHGLHAIARANALDPEAFEKTAEAQIFLSGYLTGNADEAAYWRILREQTGIKGSDSDLRGVILEHFTLRSWMFDLIRDLRGQAKLAILSDQTDWLDELEARWGFFQYFDYVFNSYHTGKSKLDPSVFDDVLGVMAIPAEKALFVDDRIGNIERAASRGLLTLHYTGKDDFLEHFARFIKP